MLSERSEMCSVRGCSEIRQPVEAEAVYLESALRIERVMLSRTLKMPHESSMCMEVPMA